MFGDDKKIIGVCFGVSWSRERIFVVSCNNRKVILGALIFLSWAACSPAEAVDISKVVLTVAVPEIPVSRDSKLHLLIKLIGNNQHICKYLMQAVVCTSITY